MNRIQLELISKTASMTRYQRTFEQQMKKKQIRVKNMLMRRIKRVVKIDSATIDTSMQTVHDSFCIDVENLFAKKLTDEKSNLQIKK